MSIKNADIEFNPQGTPVARAFDDVYFSNDDGLAESRYVFMQQNDLPQAWHHKANFCILETGFGTGLNFLLTWQLWQQTSVAERPARLHFISTEKFPLTASDLQQALSRWPDLQALAEDLLQQYPTQISGCHRLSFNSGHVLLDLWLGDIHDSLPAMQGPNSGWVDAFYLDGFAPSKNPQMWQPALFAQMARLSKPGASFATFTAAGVVKRGLRDVGFAVEKRPGFGKKRDMLAGTFQAHGTACGIAPKPRVTVVGAGLAGANIAHALVRQGFAVTVYGASSQAADGASGNSQGGFYPLLNAEVNSNSLLHAHCFSYARRFYQGLLDAGYDFAHQWCGVLQLGFNAALVERYQKLIAKQLWPSALLQWLDAEQASKAAGIVLPMPALCIPSGGWIEPPALIQAMLDQAQDNGDLQLMFEHRLQGISKTQNGWRLDWQNGSASEAEIVVLATGAESIALDCLQPLPLRPVRGQVEQLQSTSALNKLQTVLCHKGYLTPAHHGAHAMGATFIKEDTSLEYRASESTQNLATLQQALAQCPWVNDLVLPTRGRASIRCTTPDHLPIVGPLPDFSAQQQALGDLPLKQQPTDAELPWQDNLFVLTGLGARGLCTAPLLAEALACHIAGKTLPLDAGLLAAVSANRFLRRAARKGISRSPE